MPLAIEGERGGKPVPLVLLHSLLTDSSAYRPLAKALGPAFAPVAPILPGFPGGGPAVSGIEAVADCVARDLAARGVRGPFHLLGNGYGGFVALALAQRHGKRIDRLILLDAAAAFPLPAKNAFRQMREDVARGGMSAAADVAMARVFPENFRNANPATVAGCRKVFEAFDAGHFAINCQNLIDVDLRSGLGAVDNPAFVLVGTEDQATPPALARELAAAIPDARYQELPGLGHAPHLQAPDRVASLLLDFLSTNPARQGTTA